MLWFQAINGDLCIFAQIRSAEIIVTSTSWATDTISFYADVEIAEVETSTRWEAQEVNKVTTEAEEPRAHLVVGAAGSVQVTTEVESTSLMTTREDVGAVEVMLQA